MKTTFLALLLFGFCSTMPSANASTQTGNPLEVVRDYEGWAVLKRQIIDPQAPVDAWVSMRDIKIMDNGQKVRIMDGDAATPYELELIVITYTKTNVTVLKLALYEDGKDKAVTYIWGVPGTERLGMNLRWFQTGLTLVDAVTN